MEVRLLGFALSHETDVGAEPIDLIRGAPFGSHTQADPDHAMLHRMDHKSFESVEFIPRETLGVCKASGEFVSPSLFVPYTAASIDEGFELRGHTTHVGRSSKNDRVSSEQSRSDLLVFPTTIPHIACFDPPKCGRGLRHAPDTFGNRVGKLLGVPG